MNRLLCIAISALAFFINANAKDLVPQIKVTRVQLWYVNQKYISVLNYQPTKYNETYNNITVHWTAIKDFPADITLISNVYVTDCKHENAKLLLTDNTPICKQSPHRQLLPPVLVLPECQLHGQCMKAGDNYVKDSGDFRFDLLVPNIHEIGEYYYTHHIFRSKNEVLIELTFYSEWGYLKKY